MKSKGTLALRKPQLSCSMPILLAKLISGNGLKIDMATQTKNAVFDAELDSTPHNSF